jgi:hypothetical protein
LAPPTKAQRSAAATAALSSRAPRHSSSPPISLSLSLSFRQPPKRLLEAFFRSPQKEQVSRAKKHTHNSAFFSPARAAAGPSSGDDDEDPGKKKKGGRLQPL